MQEHYSSYWIKSAFTLRNGEVTKPLGKENSLALATKQRRGWWRLGVATALLISGAIASLGDGAFAQIIGDTTLGNESSRVTSITPTVDQINGGATRGANLFHSFLEFNVGNGRSVFFTNPAGIENILTRVTGANVSNILGTLGVTGGNANLFLINPNGIIFGENARLDVGGSFVASTASSIKFADGTEFSAVNPSAPPLLTISVPIGLQFNGTEGDIVVRTGTQPTNSPGAGTFTEAGDAGQLPDTAETVNSQTSGTTFNAISGTLDNNNDVDLYEIFLPSGQTFSATTVGGSAIDTQLFVFDVSGSLLYDNDDSAGTYQSTVPIYETFTPAESGTYYLGISSYDNDPVSSAGLPLSGWNQGGSDSGPYTITLTTHQGLQVQPGKTLAFIGGNVSLDGGRLLAPGSRVELGGLVQPGTVGLNVAQNNLTLSFPDGVALADVSLTTGAQVNVRAGGGGSIAINARNLNITGISTRLQAGIASGLGSLDSQAGDIEINATEAINLNTSVISNNVQAGAVGKGGDIYITTGSLFLSNGAFLRANTRGQGDAGSVNILARDMVSFDGTGGYLLPSGAFSQVESGAVGKGGNINITTRWLSLTNGAQVNASTFGNGNGGNVNINASERISLDGVGSKNPFPTGVYSQMEAGAVGKGGDIYITTGSLFLTNGATVSVTTKGQGDAGSVNILARDIVSFDGVGSNGFFSGAFGGGITITTKSLALTNGGLIASTTYSPTRAGDVYINATESVEIVGTQPSGFPTAIFADTWSRGSGGDIEINTRRLSIRDGAQISTATYSLEGAPAGTLRINATESVEVIGANPTPNKYYGFPTGLSAIASQEFLSDATGSGGDIQIVTGRLTVRDGGRVSVTTSSQGNAGTVDIKAQVVEVIGKNPFRGDMAQVVQGIGTTPDGVDLSTVSSINSESIRTALGNGGNVFLRAGQLIVRDGAEVSVNNEGSGNAGSLRVEADSIFLSNGGKLIGETASGRGGDIRLQVRDFILMRNESANCCKQQRSAIATTAQNNGTGGNITINSPFIVAVPKENSDIVANADQGFGGRIDIRATGIYGLEFRDKLTPLSDINASSNATGKEGTVDITTPGIDPSRGLTNLPENLVDSSELIANSCIARGSRQEENSFVITGTGGLPPRPGDGLTSPYPTGTVRSIPTSSASIDAGKTHNSTTSTPAPLVEAKGWMYGANGEIILTAQANTVTPSGDWSTLPKCD